MIPKFEDVLKRVESGETIQVACLALGCKWTSKFYRSISDTQKNILRRARLSNGKYLPCIYINRIGGYSLNIDDVIAITEFD